MHPASQSSGTGNARPTQVLHDEHRMIERVLFVIERLARDARESGSIDLADGRDAVDFIVSYADRIHHGKEEAELFPAMERCGLPREVGPTAVMRAEHDEGRALVRHMQQALSAEPFDAAAFARHGLGFVSLLRDHITKEDQVLFPMAEQMLPPAAREELLAVFQRVNDVDIGEEERARCLAIAARLTDRYGSPGAPAGPGGSSCCTT